MGFRDYNPGLNRFLTRDTYTGALADLNLGTDPYTGNRYAFTGGNPVSRVELDGHISGGDCGPDGIRCGMDPDYDADGSYAAAATAGGMKTLRDDGLSKVATGLTTLDEVIRVTMRATK